MFNATTMKGEGSFFIPGALVNLRIFEEHIYVMFSETSADYEYCSNNLPVFADSTEGDCSLHKTSKDWTSKTHLQVARLSPKQKGEGWKVENLLRGEETPRLPSNVK